MCGITGGYLSNFNSKKKYNLHSSLSKLSHRGPDDQGLELKYISEDVVALGHTRLSIIDISMAAHQPMRSIDGRYSLIFNGEIYNYIELRNELINLGYQFHSDSDTEVLLKSWIHWGIECLPKLLGMFAFVIFDSYLLTLTCARDAFGIKPFFYAKENQDFIFSSEQPSLIALRDKKPEINWQRAYDYLVHGDYDSQEYTFIDGIKQLPPAHLIVFNISTKNLDQPRCWWQPAIKENTQLTFNQAVEATRAQFLENIKLHLRSDVPLGAALSGGTDSSAIVFAMRYLEPEIPIHTFSYIPQDSRISEEKWINLVNSQVNAIKHTCTFTDNELIRDLENLIRFQGEPFGSTSIYAQYRVFEQVKKAGITVILEGQGADELLAGYFGYPGERLMSLLETGRALQTLNFSYQWSQFTGRSYKESWMYLARKLLPDNHYKQIRFLTGRNFSPKWLNTDLLNDLNINLHEIRNPIKQEAKGRRVIEELANSLQYRGLPALLRHSDRNSMAFSIESRVPFLTIPMAELTLSLPEDYLIGKNGENKSVFRSAMRGIVPDIILDRKDKIGFATPRNSFYIKHIDYIQNIINRDELCKIFNKNQLINFFEKNKKKESFAWQNWRLVNFIIWHHTMIQNTFS